jgi:hypothetical protein
MSFLDDSDLLYRIDEEFWENLGRTIVSVVFVGGILWGGYAFREGVKTNADQLEQIALHFDASGAQMTGLRYGERLVGHGDDEHVQRGAFATVYNGTAARIQLVQGSCRYRDPTGRLTEGQESTHDLTFVSDEDIVIKPGETKTFHVRGREAVDGEFYDKADLPNMTCEIQPMFVQEDQVKAINWRPLP